MVYRMVCLQILISMIRVWYSTSIGRCGLCFSYLHLATRTVTETSSA